MYIVKKLINMTIKGLKPTQLIDIQISGSFHSRLQSLLIYLSKQLSEKEFTECIKLIKENKEDLNKIKPIYFQIQTILVLIREIENTAIKNNLVTEQEIPETSK